MRRRDTQRHNGAAAAETRAALALAEQRLADLKAMLDEMCTERDAWRDLAQRLALPKLVAVATVYWLLRPVT